MAALQTAKEGLCGHQKVATEMKQMLVPLSVPGHCTCGWSALYKGWLGKIGSNFENLSKTEEANYARICSVKLKNKTIFTVLISRNAKIWFYFKAGDVKKYRKLNIQETWANKIKQIDSLFCVTH